MEGLSLVNRVAIVGHSQRERGEGGERKRAKGRVGKLVKRG